MSIDIKENPAFTAKKYISFVAAHLANSIGVSVDEIAPGLRRHGSEAHYDVAASFLHAPIDAAGYIDLEIGRKVAESNPVVVARIAELEESNRNLAEKLERRTKELGDSERRLESNVRVLHDALGKLKVATKERDDFRKEIAAKDAEIERLKVELHDTAQGYALRKVTSKALEEAVTKKDSEIGQLKFDLAEMTAARDGRQKNFDRLLERVRSVTGQVSRINVDPGVGAQITVLESGKPWDLSVPIGFAFSIAQLHQAALEA